MAWSDRCRRRRLRHCSRSHRHGAQPPPSPPDAPAPPPPAAEAEPAGDATSTAVPLRVIDQRMSVDVMINGAGPFRFIVDSGATRTVDLAAAGDPARAAQRGDRHAAQRRWREPGRYREDRRARAQRPAAPADRRAGARGGGSRRRRHPRHRRARQQEGRDRSRRQPDDGGGAPGARTAGQPSRRDHRRGAPPLRPAGARRCRRGGAEDLRGGRHRQQRDAGQPRAA